MKKVLSRLSITFLLILTSLSCSKEHKAVEKAESVADGNIRFAFDIYSELKNEKGNLFISPYSISSALAMTYGGAKGDTEKEMAGTLSIPADQEEVHKSFAALEKRFSDINSKGNVKLRIANSIYPQKKYTLLSAYKQLLKENYNIDITPLDFKNQAEKARLHINSWVENKTENKIQDIIAKGTLNASTRLVLVNAVYFKGDWKSQFDKKATRETDFFNNETVTKVEMMFKRGDYQYAENDHVQIVELPYKGDELSMYVILPKQKNGLNKVEPSLTPEYVQSLDIRMMKRKILPYLPKFKIEWGAKAVEPALKKLGMKNVFSSKADFSGMTGKKDIFIESVLHKSFIEVNEEGTEAAAATAVTMRTVSISTGPEPISFRADHPFFFMIREKNTGTVLFMGRVVNPK